MPDSVGWPRVDHPANADVRAWVRCVAPLVFAQDTGLANCAPSVAIRPDANQSLQATRHQQLSIRCGHAAQRAGQCAPSALPSQALGVARHSTPDSRIHRHSHASAPSGTTVPARRIRARRPTAWMAMQLARPSCSRRSIGLAGFHTQCVNPFQHHVSAGQKAHDDRDIPLRNVQKYRLEAMPRLQRANGFL